MAVAVDFSPPAAVRRSRRPIVLGGLAAALALFGIALAVTQLLLR
ncbi:MAG TPA: hypothetical protein VEQ12_07165 [Candidatus Limnocylindria bacterium]|nr:hypothetical protein [Candidatus Limnocylindria bacterium]